jgi:hypothetical protein
MIETQKVVHNHQLVQVTSTQGHHIQHDELRIKDKNHDEVANYQL